MATTYENFSKFDADMRVLRFKITRLEPGSSGPDARVVIPLDDNDISLDYGIFVSVYNAGSLILSGHTVVGSDAFEFPYIRSGGSPWDPDNPDFTPDVAPISIEYTPRSSSDPTAKLVIRSNRDFTINEDIFVTILVALERKVYAKRRVEKVI